MTSIIRSPTAGKKPEKKRRSPIPDREEESRRQFPLGSISSKKSEGYRRFGIESDLYMEYMTKGMFDLDGGLGIVHGSGPDERVLMTTKAFELLFEDLDPFLDFSDRPMSVFEEFCRLSDITLS